MAVNHEKEGFDIDDLRVKATPQKLSPEDAKEVVQKLNDEEASLIRDESKRRTYGRTPNGTGKPRQLSALLWSEQVASEVFSKTKIRLLESCDILLEITTD